MRLTAIDCVHRGLLSLRANWQLVLIKWLQTLLMVVLTVAGFLPPIAVLGLQKLWPFEGTPEDWSGLFNDILSRVPQDLGGCLPLALSLVGASLIWLLAFFVYCYFQGGIFGILVSADRQASPGQAKGWQWFQTFNFKDFHGWGSRYLWRYFWLVNLIVLVMFAWAMVFVGLAGLAFFASQRWGGMAALGIGCGGLIPVFFGTLVLALWSNLAMADLALEDSGVWMAARRSLQILGQRFWAVLLMLVLVVIAGVIGSILFVPVSLGLDFVLKDQFIVWALGRTLVTLLQWAWSGAVTVGFAASMVSLVRSEVTQETIE
ncbi:MAG: hypothetical protein WBH85_06590 [Thermoanaerobaculia bacterium]